MLFDFGFYVDVNSVGNIVLLVWFRVHWSLFLFIRGGVIFGCGLLVWMVCFGMVWFWVWVLVFYVVILVCCCGLSCALLCLACVVKRLLVLCLILWFT